MMVILFVLQVVLVRQRPGTAGGICFITIEDEEGNANLVVFRQLFEDVYRKEILQSKLLMVQGRVQKEGKVIHIIVRHCEDWSKLLRKLTKKGYNKISVHTLSPRDERDGTPFNVQNKRTHVDKYTRNSCFLMREILDDKLIYSNFIFPTESPP